MELVHCCRRVKAAFYKKAMARLKNIVGDWKEKWRVMGDDANETYLSNDVWKGLKAYWNFPKSVQRSLTCSTDRFTCDDDGNLPVPHTSRQIPHAGRALQIVSLLSFLIFIKYILIKYLLRA